MPPPPLLPRQRPIQLPNLSSERIDLHHDLVHHPEGPRIMWEMHRPPSSASFAHQQRMSWNKFLHESAVYPPRVDAGPTTLTIRIPHCERPIVTFPAQRADGDGVVHVRDVLDAVYGGIVYAATAGGKRQPLDGDEASVEEVICRSFFNGVRYRWAGLRPSTEENDVWVLHLDC